MFCFNAPETHADFLFSDIQPLLDNFSEDTHHLSAQYLIQLIASRGWTCATVCVVKHYATTACHYLVLLDNGHPVCDCMMGTNLGIPCRHFYAVLRMSRSQAQFHLGLLNRRYDIPLMTVQSSTNLTLAGG
jgi:hypothetical protein